MRRKLSTERKLYNTSAFLLFLLLSFAFLSIFAHSTSPFYRFPYLSDSGIFQIIGKGWTEGLLPYKDLWDNKGPLLYLINAIGYLLTGNKYGVFILQIINLTTTLFIIYKIFQQEYRNGISVLWTMVGLIWLANTNLNNNPAEWLIVPQSLSFYMLYRWLRDYQTNRLSWISCMVFGGTIGCGMMLRLSDCLPLAVSLVVIVIYLIGDSRWKEFIRLVFFCMIGFVIVVIPFIIYFYFKGALNEMWYASFVHNIEYIAHSKFKNYSLYAIGSFILSYAVYFGTILSSLLIILFNLPSKKDAFIWFIASTITIIFVIHTFARGTYGTSSLPLICFMIFQIDELLRHISRPLIMYCGSIIVSLVIIVFSFQVYQEISRNKNTDLAFFKSVEQIIPPSERNSFIGYDIFPDTYYYTSLKPIHRFFITYAVCIGKGDTLIKKIRKEYKEKKAKWVLVRNTRNPFFIKDIIQQSYQIEKKYPHSGYTLYTLK